MSTRSRDSPTDSLYQFGWSGATGGRVNIVHLQTQAVTSQNLGKNAVGGDIRIFNPGQVTGAIGIETVPALAGIADPTGHSLTIEVFEASRMSRLVSVLMVLKSCGQPAQSGAPSRSMKTLWTAPTFTSCPSYVNTAP